MEVEGGGGDEVRLAKRQDEQPINYFVVLQLLTKIPCKITT